MNRTVLICDDAMFMRAVIGSTLTGAGFTVVGEAGTGREAVEKFEELKPDFMTMDVVMPELGGIDAVKKIKAMDPDALVLMCSALGQEQLVTEAMAAGAKGFVVKPFQSAALLAEVESMLGAKAATGSQS